MRRRTFNWRSIANANAADVNTAVTILEIAPLDAALAVSGAMSITVSAISLVAVHLGTDDRTDGEAANDAGGDLLIAGPSQEDGRQPG